MSNKGSSRPGLQDRVSDCTFTRCKHPDIFLYHMSVRFTLRDYFWCFNVFMLRADCSWWCHQMQICPRHWPFVWGIHRSPVNSPHKGHWRGSLMFSLIYVWINCWVNNREAGDFIRHRIHYVVAVMYAKQTKSMQFFNPAPVIYIYIFIYIGEHRWNLMPLPISVDGFKHSNSSVSGSKCVWN